MWSFRVLLCVGEDKIILINDRCAKLAEYPASLVALCGTCADDKRFFGLVTNSRNRDSRCVFVFPENANEVMIPLPEGYRKICHPWTKHSVA